jgi:hypothetical protein
MSSKVIKSKKSTNTASSKISAFNQSVTGYIDFDSLTGITESESGEFSDELKIMGLPELHTNRNCASDGNAVLTKIGY